MRMRIAFGVVAIITLGCVPRNAGTEASSDEVSIDEQAVTTPASADPITLEDFRIKLVDGSRWLQMGKDVEVFFEELGYPRDPGPGRPGTDREYWARENPQGPYEGLKLYYEEPPEYPELLVVTQVQIRGSQYEMARGIRVGMEWQEALKRLGTPTSGSEQNDMSFHGYSLHTGIGDSGIRVDVEDGVILQIILGGYVADFEPIYATQ